jgi:hypothetical protein
MMFGLFFLVYTITTVLRKVKCLGKMRWIFLIFMLSVAVFVIKELKYNNELESNEQD